MIEFILLYAVFMTVLLIGSAVVIRVVQDRFMSMDMKEALAYRNILRRRFRINSTVEFVSEDGFVRLLVIGKDPLPETEEMALALQREVTIERNYKKRPKIIVVSPPPSMRSELQPQ